MENFLSLKEKKKQLPVFSLLILPPFFTVKKFEEEIRKS